LAFPSLVILRNSPEILFLEPSIFSVPPDFTWALRGDDCGGVVGMFWIFPLEYIPRHVTGACSMTATNICNKIVLANLGIEPHYQYDISRGFN
jgi:hypothetical protein